ncbi:MAG: TonB-dependent receptor, partial [Pseudomonadota bacterium]
MSRPLTQVARLVLAGLIFNLCSLQLFAQSSQIQSIELPAQNLASALTAVGDTFGVTVFAPGEVTRGVSSEALSGRYDALQAVRQLLINTDLEARQSTSGAIVVERKTPTDAPTSATAPLPRSTERPPARPIEEIIVTGTKKNLSLQNTQVSVALVTEDDIIERSLFNVEDIILRTANVSTDASGALNNLSIRGITLVGVGFTGTGSTANVYVDGAPNSFNANQGAANLWDVAQVEILRGPQSTVQGRNALAGAVIINTADPEYTWGADLRVLGGNEDNENYSATLTGPLLQDQLAFRLAVDQRKIDFGVNNIDTGNNTRFRDELTARAKLLWEPVDDFRMELIYSFVDTEFGEFNTVNAPVAADDPTFGQFDPFGSRTYGPRERFEFNEVERYTLDTTWNINDHWTLYAIGTFEDSQRDTNFGSLGRGDAPDETYTMELRAAFDYGRLTGWVGAYYFDTEGSFSGVLNFSPAVFGIPTDPPDGFVIFDTFQEDETINKAIFADVSYEFNDRWSISQQLAAG